MNDWLPNHTEHKPTAFTVTMFQLTISFHKEKKTHLILSIDTVFSVHRPTILVYWPPNAIVSLKPVVMLNTGVLYCKIT